MIGQGVEVGDEELEEDVGSCSAEERRCLVPLPRIEIADSVVQDWSKNGSVAACNVEEDGEYVTAEAVVTASFSSPFRLRLQL